MLRKILVIIISLMIAKQISCNNDTLDANAIPSSLYDMRTNISAIELFPVNFQNSLDDKSFALVFFFKKNMGDFQKISDEYEKAAKALNYIDWNHLSFATYKLDCDYGKDVCQSEKITEFPKLRIYRRGTKVKEFDGKFEFDDIKNYIFYFITHYHIEETFRDREDL